MNDKISVESFDYNQAFSRNIGWLTPEEQNTVKNSRVAIIGMGGVGGGHLIALTRLGVENFHIADLDTFDMPNFNRQYGAAMNTLGRPKTEVMVEKAKEINPNVKFKVFATGVDDENINEFLDGVDVFVDGVDFFELIIRQKLFQECHKRNIHALTAAPVGMGASLLHFSPDGMSFDNYFGFKENQHNENIFRFIAGLTPTLQQRKYLVAQDRFNIAKRTAPSTAMGCVLSSGVMATETLKVILKRGKVKIAPWSLHFDAYNWQFKKRYMWAGAKNPFFRIKLFLIRLLYKRQLNKSL